MVALSEVAVDIVASGDEARFRDLLEAHHYLGALPGMGETVRYVAHHRGRWLALLVFSAPALKCRARDRWIGWDFGVQFNRLHLVTNNSRFLILPGDPRNLGSRVLSLCKRRLARDWPARFGHPLLLLEMHRVVRLLRSWSQSTPLSGIKRLEGRRYQVQIARARRCRVFGRPEIVASSRTPIVHGWHSIEPPGPARPTRDSGNRYPTIAHRCV